MKNLTKNNTLILVNLVGRWVVLKLVLYMSLENSSRH